MPAPQRSNDLEILEERTGVEVPRGPDGCLRFTFTQARSADGKPIVWHSLREFYRADDGAWRPTKKGITIRGGELGAIAVGLLRACSSRIPENLHPMMKELVAALLGSAGETPRAQPVRRPEHRRTSAARPGAPLTEREITEDDRNF